MSTATWTPPAGMAPDIVREWRAFYSRILTTYGITPAEYRALYLAQLGRCYICQSARGKHPDDPKGRGGRRLGVDHNHVVGNRKEAVRALLCTGGDKTCNRIIGWIGYEALSRARHLLAAMPAQAVFAAVAEGVPDDVIQGSAFSS